jgi:ribosomal protein L27
MKQIALLLAGMLLLILSCKKTATSINNISLPGVATSNINLVTDTSAMSGGNVVSTGNSVVRARGVCWSTSQNPTVANDTTVDGSGTGSFASSITHLKASTTYYVRAYASNSVGTAYGKVDSFTTQSLLPFVSTTNITSVTDTSAMLWGDVVSTGNSAVTARGFCWSTSQNPTVANDTTLDGSGTGDFAISITHLIANTTFYVRAYASNKTGTAYGKEDSFSTTSSPPDVSTTNIPSVTDTSAISGGDVVSSSTPVIERGVCWSTSPNPTVADDTTMDGGGVGIFVSSITRLLPNTTYYVRAYASNKAGTAYGPEIGFTTAPPPPPPFSATCYGTYTIGTAAPQDITIQITDGAPHGSIEGNAYPIKGTYTITGGSFNLPHLAVTATYQEVIIIHPNPYFPYDIVKETIRTSVSFDGQLVDSTWSGTINISRFSYYFYSGSYHYNRGSQSGSFICHRR